MISSTAHNRVSRTVHSNRVFISCSGASIIHQLMSVHFQTSNIQLKSNPDESSLFTYVRSIAILLWCLAKAFMPSRVLLTCFKFPFVIALTWFVEVDCSPSFWL